MSTRAEQAPPASVVAAVAAGSPGSVAETLAAVGTQVYGARRAVILGGGAQGRSAADDAGVGWFGSLRALLSELGPEASHVWVLSAGASPRPDALSALVADADRAGAVLAGSKILDKEDPELLVSVGIATDAFDIPYLGLDAGEVDAGQYDVVRDVAAVDGTSLLVRRDLASGLKGFDPLLPIRSASIDLSQRARLRSARVVVVPSSEVLFPRDGHSDAPWRDEAGYIRAMLKSYSLLTLAWALPLAFLIGMVEAVFAPLVGRWTLFRWIRSWLWNGLHLLSALKGRLDARRGDVIGDFEFFRYQVRGSAKLRALVDRAASRLADRLGPEERTNLAGLGKELRRPSLVAGFAAVVFVILATRSVWSSGFPAVGYSLPLPASGSDALAAYAGGWNPGGFGSIEQLPPLIGFGGALQLALLDSAAATTAVLILGAFLSGVWGTTRLLRTWGVGPVAGILAGVALMAGPAARGLAADTGIGTLLGLGVLPWAIRIPLLRWPARWHQRVGRIASAGFAVAIGALFSPQLLVVPAGAFLVWTLLNISERAAWRAAAVSVGGALLALPVLLPWADAADVVAFFDRGSASWEPGPVLAAAFGLAFAMTLVAVPSRLGAVTAWGGVLVGIGAVLARSGDFGPGREVGHLGLAIVSLGAAVVIGVAVEGVRRVTEITGPRRVLVGLGGAAAVLVAGSALLVVVPGRAGLPADELSDRIGFTAVSEGDPAASRILLIGPVDDLPGESRTVRGAGYRVVSAPSPEMWEVWLPDVRAVDLALEADLEAMIDGRLFRGGAALARYGIRWVISVGSTPLEEVFGAQLDFLPLGATRGVAFIAEGEPPVRAVTEGGEPWTRTPWGYEGAAGDGRVFLTESFEAGWGPEGAPAEWGTGVSAARGEARFEPLERRQNQASAAGLVLAFLLVVAWVGRRRE